MHAAHAYDDDYANDDQRSDGRDAAFAVFFQRFHPRLLAYAVRAWGERDLFSGGMEVRPPGAA